MKTYTIIGGVNGSGKSSLTGSLKAQMEDLGKIIDVNKITAEGHLSPTAGGMRAVKQIRACLQQGICFTQKTTLSGHFVPETARDAVARGYYVRLYYVGLDSAEECIQRIANRVSRGGHDISADIVRRHFAARWASLAAVLPYCNTAVFFDNDNGFVQVAEWRNMELLPKGGLRPRWLEDLLAYLVENPI